MVTQHRHAPNRAPQQALSPKSFALVLVAGWLGAHSALSRAANSYDCLIEPSQTVDLGTPAGGLIQRVWVKRGDRVSRNQIVVTLESRAEQAATDLAQYKSQLTGPITLAQSKIEFAKRKFARRHDMAEDNLMSQQASDDAEAELKQAQAELVEATENREVARLEYVQKAAELQLRTIRSPLDGVVVDQMMWPGEIFEPGSAKHAILKVAQLNPLRVRVIMPLSAFGKPRIGMTATVTPETQPSAKYPAKIESIDRVVDAASGTFVALLTLPNPKLDLPAGIRCKATLPSH